MGGGISGKPILVATLAKTQPWALGQIKNKIKGNEHAVELADSKKS
jgi:hypothetical protein